jgi:hypothetical protein
MFSIRNQKNERKKMKLDLISETKRVDSISNQKDRNKGFQFDSNQKNKSITLTLGIKGWQALLELVASAAAGHGRTRSRSEALPRWRANIAGRERSPGTTRAHRRTASSRWRTPGAAARLLDGGASTPG